MCDSTYWPRDTINHSIRTTHLNKFRVLSGHLSRLIGPRCPLFLLQVFTTRRRNSGTSDTSHFHPTPSPPERWGDDPNQTRLKGVGVGETKIPSQKFRFDWLASVGSSTSRESDTKASTEFLNYTRTQWLWSCPLHPSSGFPLLCWTEGKEKVLSSPRPPISKRSHPPSTVRDLI